MSHPEPQLHAAAGPRGCHRSPRSPCGSRRCHGHRSTARDRSPTRWACGSVCVQHRGGVAASPRARPDVVPDVTPYLSQERGEPVPDRDPAQVAGRSSTHHHVVQGACAGPRGVLEGVRSQLDARSRRTRPGRATSFRTADVRGRSWTRRRGPPRPSARNSAIAARNEACSAVVGRVRVGTHTVEPDPESASRPPGVRRRAERQVGAGLAWRGRDHPCRDTEREVAARAPMTSPATSPRTSPVTAMRSISTSASMRTRRCHQATAP